MIRCTSLLVTICKTMFVFHNLLLNRALFLAEFVSYFIGQLYISYCFFFTDEKNIVDGQYSLMYHSCTLCKGKFDKSWIRLFMSEDDHIKSRVFKTAKFM